ncbi:MAG: hypothetical protein V9E93_19570 [Steroidobacteraceae bacterium]|nr:hypothetical protein [Pseudomonadota bacterium]MBP6106732.1 hypothetical protein [Steroidobacteraceae bacterium]MBP7013165.1 hypothetical protein [Steroidobacteraceae bacterium]
MPSPLNPRRLYTLKDSADALRECNANTPHSPSGLRVWADQGRIEHLKLSDGSRVIRGSTLIRLSQRDAAR